MKNEHNGECCKTSEQLPNPAVTLLVDILLNPFCMVSQHLTCRTFTFAGLMLSDYIPLLWPDTKHATGWQAEQDEKDSYSVSPLLTCHASCSSPFSALFYARKITILVVYYPEISLKMSQSLNGSPFKKDIYPYPLSD